MSRYLGSSCKLCRRERDKLFLKGEKCFTKCTLEKKRGKNTPGMNPNQRMKVSEYAKRLREKQKAKRIYGLSEEQFRHYFERAEKLKGLTGENLMKLLELRLDNVVYRLGFFPSRKLARQMINHGNIRVNGKKVDLPGYGAKSGDKININDKMKENIYIKRAIERPAQLPGWLSFSTENIEGHVVSIPTTDQFVHPINSQLIVELYSK
jgi:small subunit ribosomal protein S4